MRRQQLRTIVQSAREKLLDDHPLTTPIPEISQLKEAVADLAFDIDRLRAALAPFARGAERWRGSNDDQPTNLIDGTLVGDLRRAMAVMEETSRG